MMPLLARCRDGCRILGQLRLRKLASYLDFRRLRSKKLYYAWRPAERFCVADSAQPIRVPRSLGGRALETEWCERRLLARIHRLTVATLRKQIAPVTASQFMNWLLRWQHIAPGTQVRGEHGTLEVIRQLQGFEIPASAWERFVLARRISDYDPAHLDQLCLAGAVGWGRLSPHPATLEATVTDENGRENRRRVIPTRVAPIAFFVREDADWMRAHHPGAEDSGTSFLSPVAQAVLELLKQRGALFFPDMVRATGRLKAEVETGCGNWSRRAW